MLSGGKNVVVFKHSDPNIKIAFPKGYNTINILSLIWCSTILS